MLKQKVSLFDKQFISYLILNNSETSPQYLHSTRQIERAVLLPSLYPQTSIYYWLFVPLFSIINSELQICFDRMLQIPHLKEMVAKALKRGNLQTYP